jgi:oxygen-independent coproporphyrinogen-3 oxidase
MVAEELIDGRAALQGRVVLTLKGRLLADLVLRKILGL